MTREEAINKVHSYLTDYLPIEDYEELDEIIKALDQEPKTKIITCKDCKHWQDDGIITTCDKNIGNGFPKDYYCTDGERN